ncbi:MAG: glutathione-disulfide reductase [Rhodospirillales bacterium]|nr:glutathione-disulfide reductase [Rhodospirillales bacterium]
MEAKNDDYDLFVIGAGSGGVRAARIAAGHGAKVGIAEGRDMGGTCVNRGCVPKKLLVYSAKMRREFDDAKAYGWNFFGVLRFKWQDLIRNKDREIKRLNGIYDSLLDNSRVDIYRGYAKFSDPHTVEVDGKKIKAKRILIATGGKPRFPDIPGKEHMISSDEAFHMPALPKKIVLIGGGYISVEFACIFRAMGSEVTVINRGGSLLRTFDEDLQTHLAEEMEKQGIKIIFNCEPTKVEKSGSALRVHTNQGDVLSCDTVMAAIGRDANTQDLNLEAAGIDAEPDGRIKTNKDSETNVPHIYAVGDIANDHNLTPVALEEGHTLADRLFGGMPNRYTDYTNIPTAVFSQPPIGTVGMTEQQAREQKIDYEIYKTAFRPMKNTLSGRDERTYMKLIVERGSRKVLGAHMLGDDAPEIIQMTAIVLKMGGTKDDFDRTIGVHPTAAEEFVTMRDPAP